MRLLDLEVLQADFVRMETETETAEAAAVVTVVTPWNEKGTKKNVQSLVGIAYYQWIWWRREMIFEIGKLYVSLVNVFVVNMSRFKEHVSWQTIFLQVKSMSFQAQSLGEYTKFMSDSAVDKAAMFYLFF